MDDDIIFGASVWGASATLDVPPPPQSISSASSVSNYQDARVDLDDFDDFGPSQTVESEGNDDDFDDFGDFGDVGDVDAVAPSQFGFEEPVAGPSTRKEWHTLSIDPLPSRSDLEDEVNEILAPYWENDDISQVTTTDRIREVEGITQVLTTAERYIIWFTISFPSFI